MDDNKKVKVMNRTNNTVGYSIPDMQNLHRNYTAKEEKIITFEELRKLSYIPGGERIIKDYLIIKDEDVLKELNMHIEPEYYYSEKEIINLMQNGTLDEFLDCLDFAPEGVIDTVKDVAVKLPLNDVPKRKALMDKTGFNVDKAIEMMVTPEKEELPRGNNRRAAAPSMEEKDEDKTTTSTRRVVKTVEE